VMASLAALAFAQAPAGVDVTGTWVFEVQTQAGSGAPQVTFKQDGEALTGHYSSSLLGEADLKGTVKGRAITFTMTLTVQGTSLDVTYTGTIEDSNSMKGTVDFAGMGEGTFTGKRK
ncbi:MAG TPA: hypothetical protein PKZ08_10040, partial [Vicinamibacterales bacterium]|nr:hypothetical protein [Vicinamibacterales bacterium]